MHERGHKPPPHLTWPRSLPSRTWQRTAYRTLKPSMPVSLTRPLKSIERSLPDEKPEQASIRNVRELTESRERAPKEHLPELTPLPPLPVLSGLVTRFPANPRTWRNMWGKPTRRPNANVGSVSVAVEVREPRLAPTDSRQPLLSSEDRPTLAKREQGGALDSRPR
jgi:hypothetical protein